MERDVFKRFEELFPDIVMVNGFTLHLSPFTDDAFGKVFEDKLSELKTKTLFERLGELDNLHIVFYILKNCFAISKLVFLLRTSSAWKHMDIID